MKKASASFESSVSICFQTRVEKIDKNVQALSSPLIALYFTLAGFAKDFLSEFILTRHSECQIADLVRRKSPDGTACEKRDAERGHVSAKYAVHTVRGTSAAAPNTGPSVLPTAAHDTIFSTVAASLYQLERRQSSSCG